MKQAKVVLGCLAITVLAACVPMQPAPPQAASGTPTIDLATSSVQFELEIKGDPHPLSAVRGIAVDHQGNLYVVDCESNRIQKFDSEGEFITAWGNEGSGDGEFQLWHIRGASRYPVGDVAVDAQGHVYVADTGNSRIQVFDSEGQFLFKWGELGTGDGQFYMPTGVAIGPNGDVYVADISRRDVQRFDSEGQFLAKWSVPDMDGEDMLAPAVDKKGNVYVPTLETKDVSKFDGEGKLLARIGEEGSGDGQLSDPWGVAVDSGGNVYVADSDNCRIQRFETWGVFQAKWGSCGSVTDRDLLAMNTYQKPSGSARLDPISVALYKDRSPAISSNFDAIRCRLRLLPDP